MMPLKEPSALTIHSASSYRSEIAGLRALSVACVIAYHFGYLAHGFLGVDVFFVISGFLISGIISKELKENTFSFRSFYTRRIRRILPLSYFVTVAVLLIAWLVMLPDDLENLAQSVIATNFFANNILQAITTKNYWNVANEFKPLMHTWSLGIEEQFYVLFPVIIFFSHKVRPKLVAVVLAVLSVISIFALFCDFPDYKKFYYLPFRFFELSTGGFASVVLQQKLLKTVLAPSILLGLVLTLLFGIPFVVNEMQLVLTVLLLSLIHI